MFPISPVSWCKALKLVAEEWRTEFCRFIEQGEASAEFMFFLEHDEKCRQACERILRADRGMAQAIAIAVEPEQACGHVSQVLCPVRESQP
jgi:hypothetical protein